MSTQFDVVINGAGIVGLNLALHLAQKTALKIAIVDGQDLNASFKNTDHLRVSSINFAQQQHFEALRVWEAMRLHASPYTKIEAWDGVGKSRISFNADDLGVAHLSAIIPNAVIQNAHFQALQQYTQVKFFSPTTIVNALVGEAQILLTLADNTQIVSKLLVGADGANSWTRTFFNFNCYEKPYAQHALVATITVEKNHHSIARQVFLPTGPLAFLPLRPSNQVSIVWSTSLEHANDLLAMDDAHFNSALTQASDQCLGDLTVSSKRQTFPLIKRRVTPLVKPRVTLVGDAAHTTHPLAGQGLNLGLDDARTLAEVIQQATLSQRDIGHSTTLRKYERARKASVLTMMAAMDGFKTLFSNDNRALVNLRNLGFQLTEQSTVAKRLFMRYSVE